MEPSRAPRRWRATPGSVARRRRTARHCSSALSIGAWAAASARSQLSRHAGDRPRRLGGRVTKTTGRPGGRPVPPGPGRPRTPRPPPPSAPVRPAASTNSASTRDAHGRPSRRMVSGASVARTSGSRRMASARGDHRRVLEPDARTWVGQHRPAQPVGQPQHEPRRRGAARRPRSPRSSPSEPRRRRARPRRPPRRDATPRCAAGPPGGSGPAVPSSGSSKARLRCTGPAPAMPRRRPERRTSATSPGRRVDRPGIDEPPDRAPEQVRLFDRLRRPDVVQAWRAVGGADDERDPGVARLDDPGVELGRGGPAGRAHDGRPPVARASPTAKKHGPPLVQADVHARSRPAAARARASGVERDPGQTTAWVTPAADPLVDQGGGEGGLGVARSVRSPPVASLHAEVDRRAVRTLVLVHGFTQTGRLWGRFGRAGRPGPPGGRGRPPGSRRLRRGARPTCAAGGAPRWSTPAGAGRFDLLGYSLGARLALHVALARAGPRRAGSSSSAAPPASRTTTARAGGAGADEDDGRRLEEAPTSVRFVRRWLAAPMFATLRRRRRRGPSAGATPPPGLASSLRLAGTGAQAPLWDRLGEVDGAGAGGGRGRPTPGTRRSARRLAAGSPTARWP